MALKTSNTSNVSSRKAKVAKLREKHEHLFAKEGVSDARFIPKMAYMPAAGKDRVIALFPSEIQGEVDVYTEFVSSDYDPEDPERRLWKWPYNPHYEDEYEKTAPHPVSGHSRYLIPIDELIDVGEFHLMNASIPEETPPVSFEDLPDPDEDTPIGQMTIRDKAAIEWKLPVSKKKWLNSLIRETFK